MHLGGIARPADGLNAWEPLVNGRERRERGVRLGLIPVGDGIEIVRAVIGVAVLDGVFQIAFEGDGIVAVPAVAAPASAGSLGGGDQRRAVIVMRELLRAVASATYLGRPDGLPQDSSESCSTPSRHVLNNILHEKKTTWKVSPTSGSASRPRTSAGMEGSASRMGWPRSS